MATVRKRSWKSGDGVKTAWIADYFDQGGARHVKTFQTKKAADAWLVTTRHEVAKGVHTAESSSVTVSEAAALWVQRGEREGLEQSTLAKYRNHADLHIKPLLGAVKLARLSAPMVEQFRDDLLDNLSRAMAKKVIGSLKAILSEAQRRGLVAQNVASTVQIKLRGRDDAKLVVGVDIPSKADITALLAKATGRWRPLLMTAIFTGMRSSELRGLTWDAVDFDAGLIHVRQRADQWNKIGSPKSEAGHRSIPMAPPVQNALREWKLACPRVDVTETSRGRLWLVFPNGAGKAESHSNIINRGLDPIQISAGIVAPGPMGKDGAAPMGARYGMHALRHFFASWAIERGFSPKRVQALMGHSSIQMTFDTYGHLFPSAEDDATKFAAGALELVG